MLDEAEGELRARLEEAEEQLKRIDERREQLTGAMDRMKKALSVLTGPDSGSDNRSGSVLRHTGKYRKLYEFLMTSDGDTPIEMTFSEIEELLGFPLPPSSRKHSPHWYGYKGSAVARAIVDAGWKARHVDLASERVEFWHDAKRSDRNIA